MRLTELLAPDRISVIPEEAPTLDKVGALSVLSGLLAAGTSLPAPQIESVLVEREELQSTGIGDGVAIPHGSMVDLEKQCGALLIVPKGLPFESIDGEPANLVFAVLGPKRASGEHLKTLARISRFLRNKALRDALLESPTANAAYDLLAAEEADKV